MSEKRQRKHRQTTGGINEPVAYTNETIDRLVYQDPVTLEWSYTPKKGYEPRKKISRTIKRIFPKYRFEKVRKESEPKISRKLKRAVKRKEK